jgi:tRNA threonylcarbamoyladenosine biosynthesis protein TsaE
MEIKTIINSPEEMKAYAAQVAAEAKAGDVYALKGNLGAGKTTFAQGFIGALQANKEVVTSPTFNLVQQYKTNKDFDIWHCDFYRLKNENEFINLGVEDAFKSSVTLIEWPQIAAQFLPKNTRYIEIENLGGDSRQIKFS